MNEFIFAAISGSTLLTAFIWIIVAACLYFLLDWALTKIAPPEPFMKIGTVIIVLVVVILVVNALLIIAGRPLI